MNRTLILALVLVAATAIRPSSQPILFEALSSKLKATSMGRAVLMMSQLKQANFNALFDALEAWANQIDSSIANENASHTALLQTIDTDRRYYNELLQKYESEIAEYQIVIRETLQSRSTLERDLEGQRKELAQTKEQKSTIESQLAEDARNFKKENDSLNSAVLALDEALKLLEKAKCRDSAYSSFAETDAQELKSIAKQLDAVPQMLIEMCDYKDAENLKKVITLLQNIRTQFTQNAQILSTQFAATKEATEEMIAQYNQKIDQIAKVAVPQLQQDIQTKDAEINSVKELLAQSKQDYEDCRARVIELNDDQSKATSSHTLLLDEFHGSLETIAECISALNASGVHRS